MTIEKTTEGMGRSIRLLLVLEEIVRVGSPTTPIEVAKTVGLPKQTVYRMFASLEKDGFVQREMDGRSYSPGPRTRAMALGAIYTTSQRTARLAVMTALAREVGETCNLVIPDRDAMVYLDRVETDWPLRVQLPVGSKVPFHCTASGKLYLSAMPKAHLRRVINAGGFERMTPNSIVDPSALVAELGHIREAGHAEDNEEFISGMVALAVPVSDAAGGMVASLAFHAPTPRMTLVEARGYLPRLRTAARELSRIVTDEEAR